MGMVKNIVLVRVISISVLFVVEMLCSLIILVRFDFLVFWVWVVLCIWCVVVLVVCVEVWLSECEVVMIC